MEPIGPKNDIQLQKILMRNYQVIIWKKEFNRGLLGSFIEKDKVTYGKYQ